MQRRKADSYSPRIIMKPMIWINLIYIMSYQDDEGVLVPILSMVSLCCGMSCTPNAGWDMSKA